MRSPGFGCTDVWQYVVCVLMCSEPAEGLPVPLSAGGGLRMLRGLVLNVKKISY